MAEPRLTVYTTPFCGDCHLVTHWLDGRGVTYREVDVSGDSAARELVRRASGGSLSVPTLVLADSSVLVEPGLGELRAALDRLQSTD